MAQNWTKYRSKNTLRVIKILNRSVIYFILYSRLKNVEKNDFSTSQKLLGNFKIRLDSTLATYIVFNFVFRNRLRNFTGNGIKMINAPSQKLILVNFWPKNQFLGSFSNIYDLRYKFGSNLIDSR